MKILENLNWRVDLMVKIINQRRFELSDLVDFLKPESYLIRKKRDEDFSSFVGKSFFKYKNGELLFNIGKNEFVILLEMKSDAMSEVFDFGKSLHERSFFNKHDSFTFYETEGPYEISNCYLRKGDYVVDAGANLGLFSVLSGNIIGDSGKVFAFEPVSKTRNILQQNIEINNVLNCKIIDFALGNSNKDVEIFIDDNNLGASSIAIKNKNKKRKEAIKQIKLDDFVEQNQISKIDFIKADIEGAERDMLKGAERTIKKFKPRIAICTYHLPDDPEVLGGILKEFVPEYNIVHKYKKIYAWI